MIYDVKMSYDETRLCTSISCSHSSAYVMPIRPEFLASKKNASFNIESKFFRASWSLRSRRSFSIRDKRHLAATLFCATYEIGEIIWKWTYGHTCILELLFVVLVCFSRNNGCLSNEGMLIFRSSIGTSCILARDTTSDMSTTPFSSTSATAARIIDRILGCASCGCATAKR